ncbi:hypothetical protein J2W42_000942 [Rhizobium tibeticum]|uniref:hypothetical protein n=1 Tax=Rhizobium tibeticum TaxID=501024 RepID=UPI00277EA21C|nr:hypothetical protein [Rhizobium tibeticum]MDP9808104.1 hypothetical protein [Rhizobium tibeticum]
MVVEIQKWALRLLGEGEDRFIQRLSRKRTGGDSFSAGWRYELAYNAHVVIVELAKLLAAYRKDEDIVSIRNCYLDQSPTEFVDDVKIKTLTDEFLVQLKSGRIDWVSVVADFKLQKRHDEIAHRDIKYRLVNGSATSLASLQERLQKRGLDPSQAEVFAYPESFPAYLRQNAHAAYSLKQLTGSANMLDQETAYRALIYVIIGESGKLSFVDLLSKASRRLYDFLTPLEEYDIYKDFEDLIQEKVPDVTAHVSGRLLHLEDAGFLQSFVVPMNQQYRDGLRGWLNDHEEPGLHDLTEALHQFHWQEVDRSENAETRAD